MRRRAAAIWGVTAALLPVAAYGSFGGTPCRDLACHVEIWCLLLGAVGVPNSGLLFILLHLVFRHPARSKLNQAYIGGVMGVVAYLAAAFCAALLVNWNMNPFAGFVPVYVALAVASWRYARSNPSPSRGDSPGSSRIDP